MNKGYLGAAVQKVNRAISKQVTGSAHALSSIDAAFQFFRHLSMKVGPIIGGHFGIENGEPHIYFMTEEMKEIIQRAPNIHCPGLRTDVLPKKRKGKKGLQTDSVEGAIETHYWLGELNICMTSMWVDEVLGFMPVCITILFSKAAGAYNIHWGYILRCLKERKYIMSNKTFVELLPGNTSDFSPAILKGFIMSVSNECHLTLTSSELEALWRYCEVHFKRNVVRVGQIIAMVPQDRKGDW